MNPTKSSLLASGWTEIAPGVWERGKTRSKERAAAGQYENQTHPQLPNSKPQRDQAPALGAAVEGEEACMGSVRVCFRGYRVRPLDPDNFAGSVKDCLDYLRHSGLIPGDEPWRITLQTEQVKVKHRKDEKTVIEVTTP